MDESGGRLSTRGENRAIILTPESASGIMRKSEENVRGMI